MAWISDYRRWLSEAESLQNAQMVVDYFKIRGWTRNAISAMLGNMRHESSINPDMYEYGYAWESDRGYGLVQWTPRSKYWNWAVSRGLSPKLGDSQLARIDYEVAQNIQWIQTSSYPLSFAGFRNSTADVNYLTEAFTWNYERPNASAGASSMPARKAFALHCYNELDWGTTSNPEEPPPPPPPPIEHIPVSWMTSDAYEVEIVWTDFGSTVSVDKDKELLTVTLEVLNEENFIGFFDNMSLKKNLLNDKLLAAETTYIPYEGASAGDAINRTVFASMDTTKIVNVAYVPEEPIVGNPTDYMQLRIVHDPSGKILSTKTFIQEVNGEARLVFTFGPVSIENGILGYGESLRLVKEDTGAGMSLPRGLIIIQWDVA